MIPNEEKRRITAKELSALLHRKNSKHKGYFYCLNFFNSFRTENILNLMEKYGKIKVSRKL